MAKAKSSPRVLWLIFRRCIIHLIFGVVIGAIWGAMCIGAAGYIIGFATYGVRGLVGDSLAEVGGIIGLGFGAAVGGIIGFVGWAVAGIIAPPSLKIIPDSILVCSTTRTMGLATLLANICYFAWCLCFSLIKYGWPIHGFSGIVNQTLIVALFGVPTLMGIGQIIGIWRGVIRTRQEKQAAPPISFQD